MIFCEDEKLVIITLYDKQFNTHSTDFGWETLWKENKTKKFWSNLDAIRNPRFDVKKRYSSLSFENWFNREEKSERNRAEYGLFFPSKTWNITFLFLIAFPYKLRRGRHISRYRAQKNSLKFLESEKGSRLNWQLKKVFFSLKKDDKVLVFKN